MSDVFDEGAAAGRDISKLAVDCPYLPPDTSGRRDEWLEGFSSTRGEVSASSDPRNCDGAREPEGGTVSHQHALHHG